MLNLFESWETTNAISGSRDFEKVGFVAQKEGRQTVTHPSTDMSQACLTCKIARERSGFDLIWPLARLEENLDLLCQNHTLYSVEIIFGLILSVRTKLGVNTDTLGEPGVARLSEEVRFGPGETSSSSKCSRRAVVGFICPIKKERIWASLRLVNKLGLTWLKTNRPNTTRTCSRKKYASRTSGTETVIGNSLKEVWPDVWPKQNWKNVHNCIPRIEFNSLTQDKTRWVDLQPRGN